MQGQNTPFMPWIRAITNPMQRTENSYNVIHAVTPVGVATPTRGEPRPHRNEPI